MCWGDQTLEERVVGMCRHASHPAATGQQPGKVPSDHAYSQRAHVYFMSLYITTGMCARHCAVSPAPPTAPIVTFACMPTLWLLCTKSAGLNHVAYCRFLWSLFTSRVSVLSSAAPAPAGGSWASCQQRRCVHVALWCVGLWVSSTQALNVNVVSPTGRCPTGFFLR